MRLAVVHLAAVSVTRRQRCNGCDFTKQPATDYVVCGSSYPSSLFLSTAVLLRDFRPFLFHPRNRIIRYSIENLFFFPIRVIGLNIFESSTSSSGFDTAPHSSSPLKMGRLKCFLLLAGKFFLFFLFVFFNPPGRD